MNEERKIIDYKVVVREVETGFFGDVKPNQPQFEAACNELIKQGYVPYDELKATSGSAGGFFSSSQFPTLSQAFVKYE